MGYFSSSRQGSFVKEKSASTKKTSCNALKKRLIFESLEDRRLLSIGVGDYVWNDIDSNGLQDAGEPGMPGIVVELHRSTDGVVGNADDALVAKTTTDAAGKYAFNDLTEGSNYYLVFRTSRDYVFTTKNTSGDTSADSDANSDGTTDIFTLSTDEVDLTRDAGVKGTSPSFGWTTSIGGTGDDCDRSIVADTNGNIFVAGTFNGTPDFDPGPGVYNLTASGGANLFLAKYSSAGSLMWAKSFSGGNFDPRCQIKLDTTGNLLAVGSFDGTADFDPGPGITSLTSFGNADIFVSKLDGQGNLRWARQMGGAGEDYGVSIAVDGEGNALTTGSFEQTADFDPGSGVYHYSSLSDNGAADIFVSKLDASGNFVWAKQLGGSANDYGVSIAVTSDGSVITTGTFQYSVDFDPGEATSYLNSQGGADIFISKLTKNGDFVWVKQIGGTEFDSGNAITIAGDGCIYETGYFRNTVDFDTGSGVSNLTAAGDRDIFVLKLDAAGNYLWAKRLGGVMTDTPYSIAVDDLGGVYTTGYFKGTPDFDPGTPTYSLASAGGQDVFISKLSSAGNFLWAKKIGGTLFDCGYSIALRGNTNVYIAGYYQNTVDFDPGTGTYNLTSVGGQDGFISNLSFNPPTDINLSSTSVAEHQPIGTVVASLSAVDPDPSATQTYYLVAGDGADDNAKFTISGNQLKTNYSFDFETKSTFSVRIGCMNNRGASFAKSFLINISDVAEEISIGDRAWHDLNENGIQDPGEPGIAATQVSLYFSTDSTVGNADDQLIATTVTDADGKYIFHEVGFGTNYYLKFASTIPNLAFTIKDAGSDDNLDSDAIALGITSMFTLTAGQQDNSRDAGLIGTPLLGDWAKRIGGSNVDKSTAMVADASGNIYITGSFSGTADFDPGLGVFNLTSAGSTDIFVAKYSPAGALLWADAMGGTGTDVGTSITLTDYGVLFITGSYSGTADFDPGNDSYTKTSAGGTDIFVSMLHTDGSFYYVFSMGGSGSDQGQAVAFDRQDYSIVLTGYFSGSANFALPWEDARTIASAGGTDAFVSKINSSWDTAWVVRMGGTSADQTSSIAVGSDGSLFTTGTFTGMVDFDPGTSISNLTSTGYTDAFVSKLNSDGTFVWAKRMGSTFTDAATSLIVDAGNNVYATGYFLGTLTFDSGDASFNLTSAGSSDIYVVKLNANGDFAWTRNMGGTTADQSFGIAVDSGGNVWTTGNFSGTADFDPGTGAFNLISAGNTDIYIAKLDADGNIRGAWRLGGTVADGGAALLVDATGRVWATGSFSGTSDFNPGSGKSYLIAAGGTDVYLAMYSLNPPSDIQVSADTVLENQPVDTVVGVLSSVSPATWNAFSYSLVVGEGDADNGSFIIDGNQLKTNAIFDYETQSTYSIRVRTTDSGGQFYEKILIVKVTVQSPATAVRIWAGGGADDLWSTPQNWAGDSVPLPGEALVFPIDASRKECVNDYPVGTVFRSIEFDGADYRLSGNTALLAGSVVVLGTATLDVASIVADTLIIGGATPSASGDLENSKAGNLATSIDAAADGSEVISAAESPVTEAEASTASPLPPFSSVLAEKIRLANNRPISPSVLISGEIVPKNTGVVSLPDAFPTTPLTVSKPQNAITFSCVDKSALLSNTTETPMILRAAIAALFESFALNGEVAASISTTRLKEFADGEATSKTVFATTLRSSAKANETIFRKTFIDDGRVADRGTDCESHFAKDHQSSSFDTFGDPFRIWDKLAEELSNAFLAKRNRV